MVKIKTLFLAANPEATDYLKLDEEARAINQKIRAAEYRDMIGFVPALAARPDDLLQSLLEHQPQIVHFSGHGSPTGEIVLVDDSGMPKPVSTVAIKALLKILKDNIRVVVLNACYSWTQAEAITQVVDCAIGMNAAIGDQAAITFAASFYRAIGFGRSIQEAFELGKVALMLEGIPEEDTPELLCRPGIDPSKIFLLESSTKPLEFSPPNVYVFRLVGNPKQSVRPIVVVPINVNNVSEEIHTVNSLFGILRCVDDPQEYRFMMLEECDDLLPKQKPKLMTSFSIPPQQNCSKIVSFHCHSEIDHAQVIVPFLETQYEQKQTDFSEALKKQPEEGKIIIRSAKYIFEIYAHVDSKEQPSKVITLTPTFIEQLLWDFYTVGASIQAHV
jgi:hypothetical protein